jgi:hypothetical protein
MTPTEEDHMILVRTEFRVQADIVSYERERDDGDGWVHYVARVWLNKNIGPLPLRHTAYIEGNRLVKPTDPRDFDGVNGDLTAAMGVLSQFAPLRDAVLWATHGAMCRELDS